MMRRFDKLASNRIPYTEFLGMVLDAKKLLEEENIWAAFKYFDFDNDNLISISDFKDALREAGAFADTEELEEITREFSLQTDEHMDFERFKAILTYKS